MTPSDFQPSLDFEAVEAARGSDAEFIIDLEGFEGPLDVLLTLARQQKVDLLKLSITALADQYLQFIKIARQKSFALAADYLVMAAWLTFLKSRLLLPKRERAKESEPPVEELAEALAFRLAKLDAMRRAAEALKALPQAGRHVFGRGDPEAIRITSTDSLSADLYELVSAYVAHRTRAARRTYEPGRRSEAYPLADARDRLAEMRPHMTRWTPLGGLTPAPSEGGPSRASYVASTLAAGLEFVKEGALEARQLEAFAEIYLRARSGAEETLT